MKRASFLLDGPIMLTPERREAYVAEMALILFHADVFRDRGASIRQLTRANYWTVEVLLLVDDARHVAMQRVVAREMSEV